MEELEAVTQVRAVCARPGDIFEKVKHISKFVEDIFEIVADIFSTRLLILVSSTWRATKSLDTASISRRRHHHCHHHHHHHHHLARNEVPGHSFHLKTQTGRVEFQTVVADHRGQDHLRRKAIYSRS